MKKFIKNNIFKVIFGVILLFIILIIILGIKKYNEYFSNDNMVKFNIPFCKTITYLNHPTYGNIICYDESDYISSLLIQNHIWEDHICKIMAENYIDGTDVLDIGANIGLNSIRMNQLKPITGKIHLFEPQPDTFLMLKFNTRNLPRVLYNMCLSDKPKKLSFNQQDGNVGGTSIINSSGDINISSIPLDSIDFPNKISLIKMDVEGGELEVLEGAKNTLSKNKPVLIIEIWGQNKDKINSKLNELNYYETQHIGGDDYIYKYKL